MRPLRVRLHGQAVLPDRGESLRISDDNADRIRKILFGGQNLIERPLRERAVPDFTPAGPAIPLGFPGRKPREVVMNDAELLHD